MFTTPRAVRIALAATAMLSAGIAAAQAPGAGGSVAMRVNDEPVAMADVTRLLIDSYGVGVLQQVIATRAVEQVASDAGVTASAEEVHREAILSLRPFGQDLTDEQLISTLLPQLLERQGVPRPLWDLTMRRNALLRKLVSGDLEVTEPMLRAEYNRRYGEQARIRHVQAATASDAQRILDLLAGGRTFEELALQYSTNIETAQRGGLLPAFSRDTPEVPQAVREAAFSLQPGQISQIVQVGADFHVIRLEEMLPPQDKPFESVRDELARQLRLSLIQQMQTRRLAEILRRTDVQYVDPALRALDMTISTGTQP